MLQRFSQKVLFWILFLSPLKSSEALDGASKGPTRGPNAPDFKKLLRELFNRLGKTYGTKTLSGFSFREIGKNVPLTDSLGLLHGCSCSQYVLGFKGHHGLHLQHGGVSQSVVHAVFGSAIQRDLNYSPKWNCINK